MLQFLKNLLQAALKTLLDSATATHYDFATEVVMLMRIA